MSLDPTGKEPNMNFAPAKEGLRGGAPVPPSPFPLLLLRSGWLMPGSRQMFSIGRQRSVALVSSSHVGDVIGVVSQRSAQVAEPSLGDLQEHGTFARIVEMVRVADGAFRIGLEGLGRFRLERLALTGGHYSGEGTFLPDEEDQTAESRLLAEALAAALVDIHDKGIASGDVPAVDGQPGLFADKVASALELDGVQAASVLALGNVPQRLRRVTALLAEAATTAQLRRDIANNVRQQFGQQQREAILREQIKAIRRELGEDDGDEDERLRAKFEEMDLPDEVRQVVSRELKRLDKAQGSESNVIRNYLEWFAALPWNTRADVHDDLDAIAAQLEADHAGLEDVKSRILEHMAVHKLSGNPRGTILALHGPPGVGKTSLGQSIADATGRPFVRIALGGVRDEAEIRGHRRTYVGAIPGRILHALRKAGVKNPVIMLDEIDKLGVGWGGSPEAALLEVLDPEQNRHFVDHYLETPFDLSEVMFIATANTLDTLSPPLRDRLELVELTGYTESEKREIARKHLLPKRTKETGVPENALSITDGALSAIIADHTREAGVRQLDRELMRICRQVALEIARTPADEVLQFKITEGEVGRYLGKPRFKNEVAERTALAGVATGLAWTPSGGDILFIETTRMPGKGRLETTGKLGDVMKESALAALSYVRSHAESLGVSPELIDRSDIHLHVPAGAVPKDGPSAGVTIFAALASLLSGRRVRHDTAMTGEVTLRGRVLPVGGIKSKVLAADRAGIHRVILPEQNRPDYDDVPEVVRDRLEVIWAADMSQVLAASLVDPVDPTDLTDGGSPDRAQDVQLHS